MTRSKQIPKLKMGTCAYCGEYGEVTKDHVPPEGLFAHPKPSDLITVHACVSCHKPWSKDDEYFKIRLCLNDQARGHPDVNGNLPSVFKALNRPEAEGLKRSLIADRRNLEVKTKAGIFLGHRAGFEVDLNRICRVVERIVRGLFFYETNQPLPKGYGVQVITNEMLSKQNRDVLQETTKTIIEPLATISPRIIGQNTFSYRYCILEVPTTTVWGLVFYNAVQFIAVTGDERKRFPLDA